MKKCYYVLLGLLVISIGAGSLVYAASMDDVVGEYNMKLKDKFWIQGEGNLRDNNTGVGTIKANKTWNLKRNTKEGKVLKYDGKCRVKGNKFIVKKTKSLRNQLEKKALKRWLKLYVRDQGENIKNMKFSYSKYKITKAKITPSGPSRLKIILHGTLSGNVSGSVGYVVRKFKYQAIVIFGDRTAP